MDGYKKIIITREKSPWGSAANFTVLLDGKMVGILKNGTTVSAYAQDGPHTLSFQKGRKIDCSISILISPEDPAKAVNTGISGSHLVVYDEYTTNMPETAAFDNENNPKSRERRVKNNVVFAAVIIVAVLAALSLTFESISGKASRTDPRGAAQHTSVSQPSIPSAQPTPSEELSISAVDLWAAYKENTVNADSMYKDKTLVVTGTITNIGQDVLTKAPCISLDTNDSYGLYPIQCFFPKNGDQTDLIAQLSDGDYITVVGECDGVPLAHVQLTDCSIR